MRPSAGRRPLIRAGLVAATLAGALATAAVIPTGVSAGAPTTLEISVIPDSAEIQAGRGIGYTLALRSLDSTAHEARLTAALPPGTSWRVELIAGDGDDACLSGIGADGIQHVTCDFGAVAASAADGARVRLEIAKARDCGSLQLSASGSAGNAAPVDVVATMTVTCPEQEQLGSGAGPAPQLPDTAAPAGTDAGPFGPGLVLLAIAAQATGRAVRNRPAVEAPN